MRKLWMSLSPAQQEFFCFGLFGLALVLLAWYA